MFRYERPVRFAEVDAARIVFFARFLDYCHDALEALFAALPGGYPHLTMVRGVGVPTVHVETDFRSPLRYGDVAVIETVVTRLGTKSVTFRHQFRRAADGVACAVVTQVVVTASLADLTGIPVPDDVRALLAPHVVG